MWTRDKSKASKAKNVWARERTADPDGAWLRDTYGLDFAERDLLRRTVERGEAVPHERLREPAAAYAQRLLARPWWRRHSSGRLNAWVLVALALGFWVMEALSLVLGISTDVESLALHSVLVAAMLFFTLDLLWLRTRRLRRAAERLNATGER
jgi:hypothetical protein